MYRTFVLLIRRLRDRYTAEEVLGAYDSLFDYAFWGLLPNNINSLAVLVVEQAKPLLDACRRKSHKNAGAPIGSRNNPNGRRGKTNQELIKNKSNVNVDVVRKRKTFIPPTLQLIQDYIQEKRLNVDAEYFLDYYATRGWKLSKGVDMKDWKAALRTWSRKETDVKLQKSLYDGSNRTNSKEKGNGREIAERVIGMFADQD